MEIIKIQIPFNSMLSKNKKFIKGFTPNPRYKAAKRYITTLFNAAYTKRTKPKKAKCWLSIKVYMKKHSTDASNYIESIQDAIFDSIDCMDDRYCCGSWDYEIDLINPRIEISFKYQTYMDD